MGGGGGSVILVRHNLNTILPVEHNFEHNILVSRVTPESIILYFSSIIQQTLLYRAPISQQRGAWDSPRQNPGEKTEGEMRSRFCNLQYGLKKNVTEKMFILLMSPKEHVTPVDYLITKDFTGLKNFMAIFS